MLFHSCTDSSGSPGLGRDLTAAFVVETEGGLTAALGYNDTLQATIIRWNTVWREHDSVVCKPMNNGPTMASFLMLNWNVSSDKATAGWEEKWKDVVN